jgi:hypothetical protein
MTVEVVESDSGSHSNPTNSIARRRRAGYSGKRLAPTERILEMKNHCHANDHLPAVEFALLAVCQRLSRGGQVPVRFEGIASMFVGMSRTTAYRNLKTLVTKRWLIPTARQRGRYMVLDHDAWCQLRGVAGCVHRDSPIGGTSGVRLTEQT